MLTNHNGTYLGDPVYNPVMELLQKKGATVFVHPAAPACSAVDLGYTVAFSEYEFETSRAQQNLLLQGTRANYSEINIIFCQAGGTIPYIGTIIADVAELLYGLNYDATIKQFKSYFYEVANSVSVNQLQSLKRWGGAKSILIGTDCEFYLFLGGKRRALGTRES